MIAAQVRLSGTVKDKNSQQPLAFATVTFGNNKSITDIDGNFDIENNSRQSLIISYIGYETKVIHNPNNFEEISLIAKLQKLDEVYISGENFAKNIIKKTQSLKSQNDPQKKLNSFRFKSYNKLIVSAHSDSIKGKIDSIFVTRNEQKKFKEIDSSEYLYKEIVDKRHLFQTEKVSDFLFDGNKLKENILGTKMSGFKSPIYEIIAFNLQSFSIYDEHYELFETKYNSPIAHDAFKDYRYQLLDTVKIDNREAFVIHFKPAKKRKAAGLEGILYIDSENFSIAKAVTRIRGVMDIAATHYFKFLSNEKIWFPSEKEFRVVKGKNEEDIKILGGTIKFEGDYNAKRTREKDASDFTYLISKSENFDFSFNEPVTITHSAVAIEIKKNAIERDENFWQQYRKEPLDQRSIATYEALDSIVKKENLENKLRFGRKILDGYLPIGFFDLDLRYLLSYNNYEGFRLGAGGTTNNRLSEYFRLKGYTAYGTKDNEIKYSIGAAVRVGIFSNSWIGASFTDDVKEIASTSFATDKRVFKIYDPRPINLSTFYNHKTWQGYIETKIIPKTESYWQLSHAEITPLFNYTYVKDTRAYDFFTMTTASFALQWNPFSDFMQTPSGKLEIEKRYPKFTFQFTQTLGGILGNDFDFSKIDFRADWEKKYLNGQKTMLLMEAGYAIGDVPLTHLYNTSPNSLTKDRLLQRMTIAGKNAFETMYFNEFFSSKFVIFQLKHGFKRLQIYKGIKPSPVFVTRMAWGDLEKQEQHLGIEYKTLRDGYFESGIELNQIYKAFGIAGFYRYGPNQLSRFEDNISIKLTLILNLGF
ncbi:DUF5686 family protein [Flavobacterium ichthyis]|nr:DUF5686 family protein [Flavobacterium ichthyis]